MFLGLANSNSFPLLNSIRFRQRMFAKSLTFVRDKKPVMSVKDFIGHLYNYR